MNTRGVERGFALQPQVFMTPSQIQNLAVNLYVDTKPDIWSFLKSEYRLQLYVGQRNVFLDK